MEMAGKTRSALLCYEADPSRCHRLIVCERIEAQTGCAVEHLQP